MLRELSSPAVKYKCHLVEIYNVKELEASFTQSYGVFSPFPEDTFGILPFSSKWKILVFHRM